MGSRSPNYPAVGLSTALVGARKIWDEEKRSPFPAAVAVKHLGFNSVNGTSRVHLAALKHYGLLKEDGTNLSLTPLAIKITAHPEGSPERLAAIREAALSPKLFKELYQSHREASDATIRAHLITNRSFGDDGAQKAIKSFRETIRLAGLDDVDANVIAEPEVTVYEDQVSTATPSLRSPSKDELARMFASKTAADLAALGVPIPDGGQQLRFSISRESEAQVIFTGVVTQEAIAKLMALLELQKDTFPTKAELEEHGDDGE